MDKKKRRAGFLFVLPWIIGILLFTLIPMIAALYIGFTDWTIIGNAKFIGLKNYQDIFKNERSFIKLYG